MPDNLEGLRHWLWERGFQANVDYTVSLAEQLVQLTVEANGRSGEFSFTLGDTIPRIAASILLAFDKNRHLALHEIPGAVSLTYTERNPVGAVYDYVPGGVTLDRSSIAREVLPMALRALGVEPVSIETLRRYGQQLEQNGVGMPALPGPPTVPTKPKKTEPLSCWDRLLTREDLV